MGKLRLKLQTKITLFIIIIVFVSICTTILFTSQWALGNVEKEVERNIMNTAQIVSRTPVVIKGLGEGLDHNIIQPYIEEILGATTQVEYIVVADMNGIRYSHPNPSRIGKRFVGGDEVNVLEKGETYISEATGTLGRAIRAFIPIYNNENKQIGFVTVGTLTQSVEQVKKQSIAIMILSSIVGLSLGIMGACLLARNIKDILLGLEPEQISKLYVEKKGILDAIHEGIIAIDENCNITLVNDSAIDLLQIPDKDVIGKPVMDVFPTSRLPRVLQSGIAEYDREQILKETVIITNRVPIKDGEKNVGAIATFRDKTQITRLAEEVTGVKQIMKALRANTHEFMNKLHVILGLIQVGELEEAKKYIINETERQQQILSLVINKIKDPTIAGLILGKFSRAKEMGLNMYIEESTFLDKRVDRIHSNILVIIIGNLLENAIEAASNNGRDVKNVSIAIQEESQNIKIEVSDTGGGIRSKDLGKIFERGFTSKEGNRGVGLALVQEMVENLGGDIEVSSHVGKGTKFIVNLPKEGKK